MTVDHTEFPELPPVRVVAAHTDGTATSLALAPLAPIHVTAVRSEDGALVIHVDSEDDSDAAVRERRDRNGSVAVQIYVDAVLAHDEGDDIHPE